MVRGEFDRNDGRSDGGNGEGGSAMSGNLGVGMRIRERWVSRFFMAYLLACMALILLFPEWQRYIAVSLLVVMTGYSVYRDGIRVTAAFWCVAGSFVVAMIGSAELLGYTERPLTWSHFGIVLGLGALAAIVVGYTLNRFSFFRRKKLYEGIER